MRALLLDEGTARLITVYDNHTLALHQLHNIVKGWIELVAMPLAHCGFVNEEGKAKGFKINRQATALWKPAVEAQGRVTRPGDFLGGPVVITGPPDDEGNETAVTDEFIALVRSQGIAIEETA